MMTSHDKHHVSSSEDGLPLMEKSSQWASNDTIETRREDGRRRHPALRLFLAFLICSTVLFGLASVHSPSFRQRFSCHNGMMGNLKPGVEGEAQSATLEVMMDKEAPQTPNDPVDLGLPNQLEEKEAGDAYHSGAAPKATKLQLLRRETNSSSVAPDTSATAKTADPGSSSTPTASSSEPSSTAEPPTSSASPTPSSPPPSSTFKTSTTTPTTSPKTSTTKAPEPPTSSSTPEPPKTDDTTIYTTRPANPTAPPPTTPRVIITTSTRTSNGEVVIVESTITVQPSITQPVSVTDPARPPASLQNSATRQEARGMVLAGLMAGAVMGVLLY